MTTPLVASCDTAVTKNAQHGRAIYQNKLSSPVKIVAPMVDQSELAWRILSRKYGAELCYTPMFHARLFATSEKYRKDMWCDGLDGNPKYGDRPLIVQFCGNDPEMICKAAEFVKGKCDGIDLNLGCPQNIAKKGHYGSFLMEEWDLISKIIKKMSEKFGGTNETSNPDGFLVSCKIRVFPEYEKSLEYAKMCVDSGAQWICIHGRLREQRGQKTGMADWDKIKYLRENLTKNKDQVVFSNGNILYPEDIKKCLEYTGCDGVMSAEGNLYNPGIFNSATNNNFDNKDKIFPRVDIILREYFEIVKKMGPESKASRNAMKSHFFKILRPFLPQHTDIRSELSKMNGNMPMEDWECKIVKPIEDIVQNKIFSGSNSNSLDIIAVNKENPRYLNIPYWRCQPYFRPVNGVTGDKRLMSASIKEKKECSLKKRSHEEETEKGRDNNGTAIGENSDSAGDTKDKKLRT
ncbi:related to tRNA-dihydrouridine(16/17) synthase [NAD(P)(+)] [Saccharomycodes ludwigii]|uniref:tRNA-dihydrouridine(16/17) synthase [NAD(P)(+)] n=1 Tax=Saccharomycodes ludwigii TaxID=36035 RepID=A0A376BBK6_9ASCO|nr:hypothetical protein SCDLUD_004357 [Saccharomycodes ludwigii]KAH3900040.1 hypothetical protein SCDLUD_004357 [Saccharomycodes ludwigii]SSD62073.1 related to tRNA-dihydrouridine(16/17) synthase [NAD(P)(+)] [Saccharomycodes ludwigii]